MYCNYRSDGNMLWGSEVMVPLGIKGIYMMQKRYVPEGSSL